MAPEKPILPESFPPWHPPPKKSTAHIPAMSSNSSAILGYPPNNEDDFFIVRGIFRSVGLFSANASRGWVVIPKEPAGYVYETKQPGIIAGMVIVILLISVVTATRLALRYYSTKMVFGSDDWVILAAAVSLFPKCRPYSRGGIYYTYLYMQPVQHLFICQLWVKIA